MYCTQCGKKLSDDSKFCTECGAKTVMPQRRPQTSIPKTKKELAKEKLHFSQISYYIMRELQIATIFLIIIQCSLIIDILVSLALFFPMAITSCGILVVVIIMKKIIKEAYQEVNREYEFHDQRVIGNNKDFISVILDGRIEWGKRCKFVLMLRKIGIKSIKKLSDEEWLDKYIELKSVLAQIDYKDYCNEILRSNQTYQQQVIQQQQQMQQQQIQQMNDMNNMLL